MDNLFAVECACCGAEIKSKDQGRWLMMLHRYICLRPECAIVGASLFFSAASKISQGNNLIAKENL